MSFISSLRRRILPQQIPNTSSQLRDHQANERTFLSWTRMGLGFAAMSLALGKLDVIERIFSSSSSTSSKPIEGIVAGRGGGVLPAAPAAAAELAATTTTTSTKVSTNTSPTTSGTGTGTSSSSPSLSLFVSTKGGKEFRASSPEPTTTTPSSTISPTTLKPFFHPQLHENQIQGRAGTTPTSGNSLSASHLCQAISIWSFAYGIMRYTSVRRNLLQGRFAPAIWGPLFMTCGSVGVFGTMGMWMAR